MRKLLLAAFFFSSVNLLVGQTTVSGGIYTNTTWSLAGSPYIVTGNIVVFDNVTLTVDPGVVVKFNDGIDMEIRGTLSAIGTLTDTIVFTSNSAAPVRGSWPGLDFQTDMNSTLQFVKVMYGYRGVWTFDAIYASWSVSNCRFSENTVGVYVNSAEVNNFYYCKFDNNGNGITSVQYSSISNCDFVSNTNGGVGGLYDTYVTNCNFLGNGTGAGGFRCSITGCTFSYNWVGLDIKLFTQNVLQNNTFTYNNTGLLVRGDATSPASVSGNTICANTYMNIENTDNINIDFRNNCWCSDDSAGIAAYIMDGYDNVNLGLLNYSPWTQCALTTDDLQQEDPVSVFPNPAVNELQLSETVSRVVVYDAAGKEILSTINTDHVDVSALAPGIYVIELMDDNGILSHSKFVKE